MTALWAVRCKRSKNPKLVWLGTFPSEYRASVTFSALDWSERWSAVIAAERPAISYAQVKWNLKTLMGSCPVSK